MSREVSHYVVTAHPPGGVLHTVKCNFLAEDSEDIIIGKSRSLEVRQLRKAAKKSDERDTAVGTGGGNGSPFPIVLNAPINGRITSLTAIQLDAKPTSLLFVTTDKHQYAVIGYDPELTPLYIRTYASGSLRDEWNQLGQLSECGPLVAIDPYSRCMVTHLYDGLVTVSPIRNSTAIAAGGGRAGRDDRFLGPVFHARLEERTVLAMTILHHTDPIETPPHLCVLHQDSRGNQHITTHVVDLHNSQVLSQASYLVMVQQQEQRQHNKSSSNDSKRNVRIPPNACEWLKKSRLDGGSSLLIPVPPRQAVAAAASSAAASAAGNQNNNTSAISGGTVVIGQRQITYCGRNYHKVLPIPPALILSWDALPPDASGMPRYLLGDEYGNLHMLTLITATAAAAAKGVVSSGNSSDNDNKIVALQLDTLGSCALANCLQYLGNGLVFCGSTLGDSQLVQIHDKPIPVEDPEDDNMNTGTELGETTFLSVIEDYTHLGPIVDFDLVPMAGGSGTDSDPSSSSTTAPGQVGQSQVVTASGSSKSGSLRVIRNGIGMREYANVELSGIQSMWNLRGSYDDERDAYLVQSFVGQTRVLGVLSNEDKGEDDDDEMMDATEDVEREEKMQGDDQDDEYDDDEVGGTLAEVILPGIDSDASTLHITNIAGNFYLQVTEKELRLATPSGELLDTFTPEINITVAAGNEAGQTVIALTGGKVLYFEVEGKKIVHRASKQMDKEVSCLNINPFLPKDGLPGSMDTSTGDEKVSVGRKAHIATLCAVGLWDDFTVRLLSLNSKDLIEVLQIHLSTEDDLSEPTDDNAQGKRRNRNNMMARSLCLITLGFSSSSGSTSSSSHGGGTMPANSSSVPGVNMLLVGLGDGSLISFAVIEDGNVRVQSKKEVSLGTQRINLIPLQNARGGNCVLATGDRPTVIYLAGMGGVSERSNYNPKLCYSNVNLSPVDEGESSDFTRPHAHESIVVNVAAPFSSPLLFDDTDNEHYSLCVADDSNLRMGVIDDIQKLHVTTYRLGMAPRRLVRCSEGRMFAVGCIESGIKDIGIEGEQMAMGNCIRFLDDSTFDDIHRIDLEPTEMILSMESASLYVHQTSPNMATIGSPSNLKHEIEPTMQLKSYLVVGTAYVLLDEDEPTLGRILIYSCNPEDNTVGDSTKRSVKLVTELQVRGGVYSICQFYEGKLLATVNSKTHLYKMFTDGTGVIKLSSVGVGHHGHILSLFVSSRAPKTLTSSAKTSDYGSKDRKVDKNQKEMLALVGDLMRSISLVQYYPQYETLEEVARDFNVNWTSAVTMLTDDVYLGGENWNNLFVLRRNTRAQSEEVRCRLDTVGEFHLGEMVNKFMSGSLVMPNSSTDMTKANISGNRRRTLTSPRKKSSKDNSNISSGIRPKRPVVSIGSQTLFGTVDGTLGVILGLDNATAAFFLCLEKSMEHVIKPIGDFSHQLFRAFKVEDRCHPRHGFVDGDLVESFLDFDLSTMERVVQQMNKDGSWTTSSSRSHASRSNVTDVNINIGDDSPQLSVDDVLAVIEEMTMLH